MCSGVARARTIEDDEVKFEEIDELSFINAGSTGCVFLGSYHGEKVAVKKFKTLKHTLAETQQLRMLRHPNIVKFKGVCTKDPVFCIVMEYCPMSLYDKIKNTQIAPDLVCDWALQVAQGMAYLHSKNTIHRDLKSPNVLVGRDGRTMKITDFGTARSFGSKSTQMSFAGSVAWMAPEMVRNEPCSSKVDVWSFGVVLWELLTGDQPYSGVEQGSIIYGIGTNNLNLPVPSTAPLGFSLLLKQCWNPEARHRPEFRQILLHLQILLDDSGFADKPAETHFTEQKKWKAEMKGVFKELAEAQRPPANWEGPDEDDVADELERRRTDALQHAEDVRSLMTARLEKVSRALLDVRARERAVEERERVLRLHSSKAKPKRWGSQVARRQAAAAGPSRSPADQPRRSFTAKAGRSHTNGVSSPGETFSRRGTCNHACTSVELASPRRFLRRCLALVFFERNYCCRQLTKWRRRRSSEDRK